MEKVLTVGELNEAMEIATDYGRHLFGWTDEQCRSFCAKLKENLENDGWEIV